MVGVGRVAGRKERGGGYGLRLGSRWLRAQALMNTRVVPTAEPFLYSTPPLFSFSPASSNFYPSAIAFYPHPYISTLDTPQNGRSTQALTHPRGTGRL